MTLPPPPADASREARLAWIEQLRQVWFEAIRPFDPELESVFASIPQLRPEHVASCRVLVSREQLVSEFLPPAAVVAEVGTQYGSFARTILTSARPRELHLIDLSFELFDRAPFEPAIAEQRVVLHEGDSSTILATFPDGYFGWIYVDGDHSYAGVSKDVEMAKRKICHDGLLVFNDYIFWSHRELMEYGVVQAVNELCLAENWELAFFALSPEMYCDVALRRRVDPISAKGRPRSWRRLVRR